MPTLLHAPGLPPSPEGPGPPREVGARERPRSRPGGALAPVPARGRQAAGTPRCKMARAPRGKRGRGPGQVATSFTRPVPEAANGGGLRGRRGARGGRLRALVSRLNGLRGGG